MLAFDKLCVAHPEKASKKASRIEIIRTHPFFILTPFELNVHQLPPVITKPASFFAWYSPTHAFKIFANLTDTHHKWPATCQTLYIGCSVTTTVVMERMTFLAIDIITSNPGMEALIKASSISFGILNYCHAAPLLTVPQRYDKESLFSTIP